MPTHSLQVTNQHIVTTLHHSVTIHCDLLIHYKYEDKEDPDGSELGAVHKLRHPIGGYGGVSQNMTKDDRGEGGGLTKDDR